MMEEKEFNINDVMAKVKELRIGFTSERDFQFIMGVAIRKLYKNANVVMEYKYPKKALINNKERQFVDIMVIINDKWYPIELKYNYKKCDIHITEELKYDLEYHSCRTNIREKYGKDIIRLLKLCQSDFKYKEGYAILLTNYKEFRYICKWPQKYWLLYEENIKHGVKEINKYSNKNMYHMEWKNYDNQEEFDYLITTVTKNNKV